MKIILLVSVFSLVSCGSSVDKLADAIATSNATPVPGATTAPTSSAPGATVPTVPTVKPAKERDMYSDYKKIAKGMTREEIIVILGNYQGRDEATFCDNGECREYEYLSWYYNQGKIGVTIQKGVATYTYTM